MTTARDGLRKEGFTPGAVKNKTFDFQAPKQSVVLSPLGACKVPTFGDPESGHRLPQNRVLLTLLQ